MIAVILAAGVGSRLGRPFPKSLSMLPTGERILGRQIRLLREAGVRHIIVVCGFKMHLVMEEFPDVYYRYNPLYYITNTSKSLLNALTDLNDDIIWLNGDVVFDPEVVQAVVSTPGNLICVDRKRVGDEEVKYAVSEDGRITHLSKNVAHPLGEAVGVNAVTRETLPAFRQALAQCADMDYFEMGVELLIHQGMAFRPLDISLHRCIEVDFDEDWLTAKEMFKLDV
jgi:L-glutamine-phosphate cytidylyltransferase